MKNLSYHGRTVEQAQWVLNNFATPEVREFYKDNKSFNDWLEDTRAVIDAERLSY